MGFDVQILVAYFRMVRW